MKALILKCLTLTALALAPLCVVAADIRNTACRTSAEYQAEANRLRDSVSKDATSARAEAQDQFYWLGGINMASTVMLLEEGIIPARLAQPIAVGVIYSIRQADQPGGKRAGTCYKSKK